MVFLVGSCSDGVSRASMDSCFALRGLIQNRDNNL